MNRQQERLHELKKLAEVSSLINSSLDIQDVLRNAMTSVQRFLDAEASSIFEIDPSTGELFFRVALGSAAEKACHVRLKPGEGVAGWVARTGLPLIVPDAETDRRFTDSVDEKTGFKTRSILCVPLVFNEKLNGVLEVLNKQGRKGFDEEDLEILKILANQVAIALENARLYSRLNERFATTKDQLETTQKRLAQSEWLAALGRLSQGVAHEVRNPVMVIGGFARRLRKQFGDSSAEQKTLDIILEAAERLERMVAAIEELTRMRLPVFEEIPLPELLDNVLDRLQLQLLAHGIEVERLHHEDSSIVFADRELMEQALRNVVQNAIDAQSNGGRLEVGIAPEPDWLVITVRDHGIGIPHETLPTVFEPFVTSKTQGSGLGLTAVHRIVCEHGGRVQIDSEPGKGTEVRIWLPRGKVVDSP